MPSNIILKKSSVVAKVPVAGDLQFGELALNYADSKLYFKKTDGTIDAFSSAAVSALVTSVDGNVGDVTATQLLTSIKTVDGASSGLDADLLDGQQSSYFLDTSATTQTKSGSLTLTGTLSATSKSFLIPHPTKEGMKLCYGSLEGPENGVYIRGKLDDNNIIELPEYWTKLVDPDSISVTLTPIGSHQNLYVQNIDINRIMIVNSNVINKKISCFFIVYGERCDIPKIKVEVEI